jgi:DNA polymerase beta thumb/SWIM zinc finger
MMFSRLQVQPFVDHLESHLAGERQWAIVGPWRRGSQLIDLLEILVVRTEDPFPVPPNLAVTLLGSDGARGELVLGADETIPVLISFCEESEWATQLMSRTGPGLLWSAQVSMAHNSGFYLSPSGVQDLASLEEIAGLDSEEKVYSFLKMSWIAPGSRYVFEQPQAPTLVERVVPSSSDPSKSYAVRVRGLEAYCSCPGFTYNQRCRHVLTLRTELGIQGPIRVGRLSATAH